MEQFLDQCKRWGVEWSEDYPDVYESFVTVYSGPAADRDFKLGICDVR